MFELKVIPGKTYLLRIINAAVSVNLFFKIADHNMTVVAADAVYTDPYESDLLVLAPGQTLDALLIANKPPAQYYMASLLYRTSEQVVEDNRKPATAVIIYEDAELSFPPKMPTLPDMFDTDAAFKFFDELTSLVDGPFWSPVPIEVDEHMFITVGLGFIPCNDEEEKEVVKRCRTQLYQGIAGSLNNVSFVLPTNMSILQAFANKVDGVYTTDFPDEPPVKFDYVNESFRQDTELMFTERSVKVKQFKYNSTVEIVFQTHTLVELESHPMHIHGHNFHVLGQGFGNYDPTEAAPKLNFVNPQMRNTVSIPKGGWVVIRFRTDNPGVWYIHCHNEAHVPIGIAGAFIVENGPTPSTMLPSPPLDFPQC